MKIKILKVYELNNTLRVETECPYGKDNLGLSLDKKYLNPKTNKPQYLDEVKRLLEDKYQKKHVTEISVDKSSWGTEVDLDKI